MATWSRTAPKDGIRPAPLFTAFLGYETLHGRICELAASRTVIAPGTLVHWLLDAYIERAVFKLDGRVECSGDGPTVERFDPTGDPTTRPGVHQRVLRLSWPQVRGRPHHPLRQGPAHRPSQRTAAMRIP